MKKSLTIRVLVGAALALTPLYAQNSTTTTASPDPAQSSKTTDSTADQNNSTTGGSMSQPVNSEATDSKTTNNALDQNPSTASTDSADKSATKDPNSTSPNSEASASSQGSDKFSDSAFLVKAAQGGMTEVELGKIAQQNASSDDVKQFGSRMVTDHSQANDNLKAVAQKEGVAIPAQLDAKHQAMVDRFQHLSGKAFDRAYVHMMVRDHEKDVTEFREASATAQDPDVKSFAASTLTVIKSHLADIKSIENKIQ